MSDMSTTTIDDDLDDVTDEPKPGDLTGLRRAAEAGKAATAENTLLKRKMAFMEAGIDVKSKIGQLFFEGWKGDNEDVDAIRAEAIELGLVEAEQADQQRQADEQTLSNSQQASAAGKSGPPVLGEGPHPRDSALEGFQRAVAGGEEPDMAREDALAKVIAAGAAGDKRVIYDPYAHQMAGVEADKAERRRIG